jgi:hypothetical protein
MHHPASPQHSQHCVMEAGWSLFRSVDFTYKWRSSTKFPTSVGMGPVMEFLYSSLRFTSTHLSTTSAGSREEGVMRSIVHVQFRQCQQLPNLRRDCSVDVVIAQVPANHPKHGQHHV